MGNLNVVLSGQEIKNPLIPASGAFGYGMDFLDFWDVNEVGSFSIKGTTILPREGNPLPRIAEYEGGMLNCVGLQNPGAEAVRNEILPELRKIYHGKVFANISGFSIEDYEKCAEILDPDPSVGWLELNISCPNVHGGGMAFGTDPDNAVAVLKAVKAVSTKPVYVKCTPQAPDLTYMCQALEQAGADGLVLLNTYLHHRRRQRSRHFPAGAAEDLPDLPQSSDSHHRLRRRIHGPRCDRNDVSRSRCRGNRHCRAD